MPDFIMLILSFIFLIGYSFACYKCINQLYQLCIQLLQKNKMLLHRISNKNLIMKPYFVILSLITLVLLIVERSDLSFKLSFLSLNVIFPFLCFPDKNDVLESSKLNIGYGAALWYYKNYLTINLPDKFLERVRTFESINKVQVDKKLYILVPESCIVPSYLDDETDCIERCQELPKCEVTNSGIKNRVYNITIYLLRNNSVKKRMAIEYAQPLKGLFAFKENKFFTEEEMLHERQLFVESLREFLKDGKDLFKFCEIVEFNDKERKVSDALLLHKHFENSVNDIV